jgi:hypothetical protein
MRQDYTHIAVVLDSSGSMASILDDTIGGFNVFLKGQKEAEGEATLTLVEFAQRSGWTQPGIWGPNTLIPGTPNPANPLDFGKTDGVNINVKLDFTPIKAVPELTRKTYVPTGGTPLLDTIAETIIRTGKSLAAMPESLRPAKVLFVIITDGEENESRVYNHQRVMEMIKHQSIVYKWEFMYLGANQDAIQVGASFGVSAARSMSYGTTKDAIGSTYGVLASKTMAFRSAGNAAEVQAALNFTAEERKSVEDKK